MLETSAERKTPDSEKITINLGAVDLGKIDLLVQEGHYSNRTDFIRTAIRAQLERHALEVQQSVSRHCYGVSLFDYTRADLEQSKVKGGADELFRAGNAQISCRYLTGVGGEAIESMRVRGVFQASAAVKAALVGRIHW